MTDDVRIPCHGEQLAAYVYRPGTTQGDAPCVVMGHGFSGTREDGLRGYAEAFCDAGFVVVVFDYRHFGDSTGEPRQLLDIGQLDDYHAVVEWARDLDGVDPDRIVLWGTSYSGGHVLALGAADARIAAVIAQGPYADSIACASASHRRVEPSTSVNRNVTTPEGAAAGGADTPAESHNGHAHTSHIGGIRPRHPRPEARL